MTARTPPSVDPNVLESMRFQSDPWADEAVAAVLGDWEWRALEANGVLAASANALNLESMPQWAKLQAMTKAFGAWQSNDALVNWKGDSTVLAPDVSDAITRYVSVAATMPRWADREKIARAEKIFMDYGPLSVVNLFCSSLPECYVVPDLAAVLQTTGQLTQHTEHRVRSTGAMIFPVMMLGGLTTGAGGGLAQIFKVRLIHATIRHLILRRSPQSMLAAIQLFENAEGNNTSRHPGIVPQLARLQSTDSIYHALFAHGWDVGKLGLPVNQQELLYTLMTFSYVYLRSMRALNMPLTSADEEAFIHAWNVAGHFLGIDHAHMPNTYDEAAALFDGIQAHAEKLEPIVKPDVRPNLGVALMNAMASVLPGATLKAIPTLMTRKLCGPKSSRALGLDGPAPILARMLFHAAFVIGGFIDGLLRLVSPRFSIVRALTKLMGYRLVSRILMDQTRELKLPEHVHRRIEAAMSGWGY
jgi:hypothetical protein